MRTYYCETCGEWFRAKAQIDIDHHHQGFEDNFMLCKPVGLKLGVTGYIGVKPIYNNSRWRAMLIYVESGYSETPSWGHEAGGWIHYAYGAMRSLDGDFIEAPSELALIQKLKATPSVQPDNYFKYKEQNL